MASPESQDSLPRRPVESRAHERTCGTCGTRYIAKSGGCPSCGGVTGKRGDEITKKVMDEPDLIK